MDFNGRQRIPPLLPSYQGHPSIQQQQQLLLLYQQNLGFPIQQQYPHPPNLVRQQPRFPSSYQQNQQYNTMPFPQQQQYQPRRNNRNAPVLHYQQMSFPQTSQPRMNQQPQPQQHDQSSIHSQAQRPALNKNEISAPNVLLYIDNSNIFESAKKHSGQKKGYRNSIPDVACRIDIGKLISKAVGNRGLLFGKLYGSEPPALDTVWEAIRRKQVHVETFQRSKWTLKEKETDASLTADAVEDIIMEKEKAGENRTVVLFSGDRDLLRVVTKAVNHGYTVEIWSFRSSINNSVKRKANEEPTKVTINHIDEIFDDITYTKVIWGKTKIPPERSLVATVTVPEDCTKKQFLNAFVAKAGEIFQLPMMGKYMDNYRYIILVPCIKERYTPQPCQAKSKSEQAVVRTYDFYKHIQPFTHMLPEYYQCCDGIKTWVEFLSDRRLAKSSEILATTRFEMLQLEDSEEDDVVASIISDDDSEDFESVDFFDSHPEVDDAEFIPVVRKEAKQKRMYSDPCVFQFACVKGFDCSYKHTEKEKEFFKVMPDSKRRYLYKTKPCYHAVCNHSLKPYLCPYAHNLEESRCLACKQKGNGQHWMHQCPVAQNVNVG